MRAGRTDEQKRALSAGLIEAVCAATGEAAGDMFLVIREGPGINFVEAGEHLPDFVVGNVNDADLVKNLRRQP
jgi:tautomerase-like protein